MPAVRAILGRVWLKKTLGLAAPGPFSSAYTILEAITGKRITHLDEGQRRQHVERSFRGFEERGRSERGAKLSFVQASLFSSGRRGRWEVLSMMMASILLGSNYSDGLAPRALGSERTPSASRSN